MIITLRRVHQGPKHTNGILQLDDMVCATLEDGHNEPKIPGKTRIPAGTYPIEVRTVSPMAARYDKKQGNWHHGMLWLQGVPGFTYVYIHIGNTILDTDGCILIGKQSEYKHGFVSSSSGTYRDFYPPILDAINRKEPVFITITDEFGTLNPAV